MKIIFISSEVVPFAKTGGLADVAGSLPKALKGIGHDVREEPLPRPRGEPGIGPFGRKGCDDAGVHRLMLQDIARLLALHPQKEP